MYMGVPASALVSHASETRMESPKSQSLGTLSVSSSRIFSGLMSLRKGQFLRFYAYAAGTRQVDTGRGTLVGQKLGTRKNPNICGARSSTSENRKLWSMQTFWIVVRDCDECKII